MIAGMILLLNSLALIGVGVALPRFALQLHRAISSLPEPLRNMASMVPGLATGLLLRTLLPRIARLCLGVGGVLAAFGVLALTTRPIPVWLEAFAYGIAAFTVLLVVFALLALRRLAPSLRELRQFLQGRMPE
ncbi:MAG: hypothetical protein RMJ43_06880 [Chloroherpetonaceae bacterium]|nr:hypothetical protein [Chthonomonadaceae bacterium]MDW8207545.1 hypothetical protein [Chloroherpetonaceae bacterium]